MFIFIRYLDTYSSFHNSEQNIESLILLNNILMIIVFFYWYFYFKKSILLNLSLAAFI